MPPRREDAAQEEGAAERVRELGARVVLDVLDAGEAERRERRVDDAVDHAVELAPQEVEDAEDGEPLHELLADGRDDA